MGISRSLRDAKDAWKTRDKEASKKAHDAVVPEEKHVDAGQYIKSMVYGGLDGIITTFAVVAGVAGASLSSGIVLILGFANLIADGLSMAVGDYLSTKAENEYQKQERKREEWEVENYFEGEVKEMVELYQERGISKKDAETIVKIISKDKKTFVDFMMFEELNIIEDEESPLKNALVTFASFGIFGFIPLFAYVFSFLPVFSNSFAAACILTALTLFALGAVKVKITGKNWLKSGLEMMVVGGIAATVAYFIGVLLSGLA